MLFDSKWITYKTGEYKTADDKYGNPSPYFRRSFKTAGRVKKATLFASALGVFKIYLNGEPLSGEYLSPGWVDYSKKLPFIRYDITERLLESNAIGVVLGDGWAVGHIGSNYTFKRNGYSDRIEFTALIRIEYENGELEEISSDKTWRASSGAIRRSDIYMGEFVDNRLCLGNFSQAAYDDSAWDYAEETVFKFSRNLYLEETIVPPIVVKHTFKPVLVSQENGTFIYDVTQNIAGVLSCVFRGKCGARVVIRHGELLENGKLYTENLRKAEATDTYILSGNGDEYFRPLFTYHGFRYAEITVEGEAEIVDITAEAMYSDLKSTGSFECSDPIVSKIYQNALWGQRDNFLNVPTDCPQRDERLGWTGDAQIFCQSAMYNMDCRKFYEKYLADVRDAQLGNGVIPAAAPLPHVGFYDYTGHDAAAGWCEAIAEIPYCHYKMYADKKIIRDNLPALKKLLDYYETESPDYIRSGGKGYGDWVSLGTPTDLGVVSTLYYAKAAELASKMCGIIGDFEEEYYSKLYLRIKDAFRARYISEDGRIKSDTQTAYVMAYKFGIIDKNEAEANLVRKFDENGGHLTTGFLGIKFLLPTLCDIGRSDIAYRIITDTSYPGWGYSVVNGATTIWEHWDSYTHENGIRKGMNSFNHYSFGSCSEWMFEYCLGIRPDIENPGFKKVKLAPYMDITGKITSASGYYDTDYGRISVSWQKNGDCFEYKASVPQQISCEFVFRGMETVESSNSGTSYFFKLKKSE
ncbi:MAG: family 78 glycoside hydrolase catalytic domain [Clostridia bacterium]|nr:family 78 glycoside hydrolase catalytic domain [Clostridia bacterium]